MPSLFLAEGLILRLKFLQLHFQHFAFLFGLAGTLVEVLRPQLLFEASHFLTQLPHKLFNIILLLSGPPEIEYNAHVLRTGLWRARSLKLLQSASAVHQQLLSACDHKRCKLNVHCHPQTSNSLPSAAKLLNQFLICHLTVSMMRICKPHVNGEHTLR